MKRRTFLLSSAAAALVPAIPKAMVAPVLPEASLATVAMSNSGGTVYWCVSATKTMPGFPSEQWKAVEMDSDTLSIDITEDLEPGYEYRVHWRRA